MTVHELNEEQKDELKADLFWSDIPAFAKRGYTFPEEIPDEDVFQYFAGTHFVNDDFFCTAGRQNNNFPSLDTKMRGIIDKRAELF